MPLQPNPDDPSQSLAASRPVACLRCRRNRSFCTKDKPNCLTCRNGKHECIYPDGRRTSVSASYLYDLEARLKAYEDVLRSLQPPVPQVPEASASSPPKNRLAEEPQSEEDFVFTVQPLTQGLDNLVIAPSGKPHYLGSSSSTILGRRLRDVMGIPAPLNGLEIDKEVATYNRDALRGRRSSFVDGASELPPYAVAKGYFYAQYSMIGTIFAFVVPEEFEIQLQRAYAGPPDGSDRDASLAYCQVLMILAFGQMYAVNQYTSSEGPPGFAYFTEGLRYLPDITEEPSVTFCGVLALTGYFMQNLNRRDAAFLYLGLAQRMAITLALHEEVSVPGMDAIHKEQRRRTWWSIYSLDRILCVKYGNPVTLHDEDVQVALPSRLPHEAEYCPAVVLRHYTILSQILGQIMNSIYRHTPRSGSVLMAAVQDIMAALAKWEREIPDQLRFNPVRLTASRESVSTFLHFYQCINMTARPLLLHVVERRLKGSPAERPNDWREGLSQTIVSVITTCIFAARDTISMMTTAAENGMVAVFGYMDGEHAFSAAIVLVMVAVAFPYDLSNVIAMDAALSVLANMASKGNHHIEARYQLLLQLGSVVDRPVTRSSVPTPPLDIPPVLQAPSLPVMDNEMLDHIFASNPETNDLSMFEAAYFGPELDLEFELGQWTEAASHGTNHL